MWMVTYGLHGWAVECWPCFGIFVWWNTFTPWLEYIYSSNTWLTFRYFRVVHTLNHNFRAATRILRTTLGLPIKRNHVLVKILHAGVNASDVSLTFFWFNFWLLFFTAYRYHLQYKFPAAVSCFGHIGMRLTYTFSLSMPPSYLSSG